MEDLNEDVQDHTEEWWYIGVDHHIPNNNYNGSLRLFGTFVWYNFEILFSVCWRLNNCSHIDLAAEVKGLTTASDDRVH